MKTDIAKLTFEFPIPTALAAMALSTALMIDKSREGEKVKS